MQTFLPGQQSIHDDAWQCSHLAVVKNSISLLRIAREGCQVFEVVSVHSFGRVVLKTPLLSLEVSKAYNVVAVYDDDLWTDSSA